MEKRFIDVLRLIFPMSGKKKQSLRDVSEYLDKRSLKEFKHVFKQDYVEVLKKTFGTKILGITKDYPYTESKTEDKEVEQLCNEWNKVIYDTVKEEAIKEFAPHAASKIKKLIAPHIVGMNSVKESVLLQLFAHEKVHVLLLGDPGTGKTEIARAISELAPISTYGLGSGTSGAGLTLNMQGKEVVKGLLPLAHKGICCIDELNLMKEKDRAGLLNAMEKGFVSYDKANTHMTLDADVKVLATANPKGDKFAGWFVDTLKKQIPFDPALLSRFNLVFLIRKPGIKGFVKIAKKIVSGRDETVSPEDAEFVKEYVKAAEKIKVKFEKKYEVLITEFIEEIKKDEEKFLVEFSPRIVVGIVRLSKAAARVELRNTVEERDVQKVLELLKSSLYIKKEKKKP